MAFYARFTRRWGALPRRGSATTTVPGRRTLLRLVPLLLVAAWLNPPAAVPPLWANPLEQRALDQQARQEAIASIPFDSLTEEARTKLQNVVSAPSIYRRLPATVIDTDPDMYLFLIRYPEVVVNIWELMGATKVQVQRTGDYTFDATDGSGTSGRVELIYGDRETHVYYAEGGYEGPLFRRFISGRCVLVLNSEYYTTIDQRVYVTNRLDMFVQLDNIGAELLAKTLHPLVGKTADHNFVESTRFLGQMSQAAETRGAKMQQLAERLNRVDATVRQKFSDLTEVVSQRAALRDDVQLAGMPDDEGEAPCGDGAPSAGADSHAALDALRDTRADRPPSLRLRR